MPPFSGKKKKEQLKAKRAKKREENERQQEEERKQEQTEFWNNNVNIEKQMCNYLEDANYSGSNAGLSQQENTKNDASRLMTYGADRKGIRSVFKRDNNEELQWSKKISYEPLEHRHFMDVHGIPFKSWFAMPELSEDNCNSMNTRKRLIELLPLATELPKRGWNVNNNLYYNVLQGTSKEKNKVNCNDDRHIASSNNSVNDLNEDDDVLEIKNLSNTTRTAIAGALTEEEVEDVAIESNDQDSIDKLELRHFTEYLKRLDEFSFVNMPPSFAETSHTLCTRETHNFSSFERNIDVWRQLWRAVELADVVVLVTDARYPIIHIHLGLLEYIVKENKKPCVVVFNKIDLVPEHMLQKWKHFLRNYLQSVGFWVMDADTDENTNKSTKTEIEQRTWNEEEEEDKTAKEINITKSDVSNCSSNTYAPIVFRTFTADPRPEVQHGSRENNNINNNNNYNRHEKAENNAIKTESEKNGGGDVTPKMKKIDSQNKSSLFNDTVDVTRRRCKREQRRGKMYEQLRSGAINVSRQMINEPDVNKAHVSTSVANDNENGSNNSDNDDDDDDDSKDDDDSINYGAHENFKGKEKAVHDLTSDKRSYGELRIVAESINLLLAECKRLGSCYRHNSWNNGSNYDNNNEKHEEFEQIEQTVAECYQLLYQNKCVLKEEKMKQQNRRESAIHIAFVGFPNVGKSSLLNCITGTKVVSVSATPGHTKHVQTIPIESEGVVLIDSPGLAFPLLNLPRPLQAVIGTHQIAQTRAPQSGIAYLASHLPLEKIYGLRRPQGAVDNEEWSAYDICEAYASKRGFFVKHGKGALDVHRAAIALLQEAYEGRLVLYFAAPQETLCSTKEYAEEVRQYLLLRVFQQEEEGQQRQ